MAIASKEILLALHFEYKGNFNKIYNFLKNREDFIPLYKKWKDKINKVKNKYVCLLDDDYPNSIKRICKPPFVILKKNIKTYKVTYTTTNTYEVLAYDKKSARKISFDNFISEGPHMDNIKAVVEVK